MTTVANIVGARPQFIKAGPVSRALAAAGVHETLIHTGQHYDQIMSAQIMADIGLRDPDHDIGVGSGSHAEQTGRILQGVEALLVEQRPDAVLVYGDTNSTLGGALAATKLGIVTAHVEAGMRSFNRSMPEEVNRIATDHVSDLLFAATTTAMRHLTREGLGPRASLTGDVMVDALRSIDFETVVVPDWARGDYYVSTIHRVENTDDADRLRAVIGSLDRLDHPVHLLAHPRLAKALRDAGVGPVPGRLTIRDPLGYGEMLATVRGARGVITDSGGLQKEAFILGVPCVTIRSETEWPETLSGAWNVLAAPGDDLSALSRRPIERVALEPFGDGRAAARIVERLVSTLQ
ncbi:MAG TPA: UDP-N-acetylglucosamine 2-epimerase (non-hydrolyzing) [Acidimicrobiia bacterium]|nr:UDP-N-acetylglucosamine 2-epimerase (non-hydrolyzing) [Acidimicrobiia bacterium]